MSKILEDQRGNKCSVEYWGSEAAAQRALNSLENCFGCYDCSRCSGCSGCYDCSDCSGCYDCARCSDCGRCSDCSGCFGCFGCSDCARCSGCYDCSRCFDKNKDGKTAPPIPVIPDIHKKVFKAAAGGLAMGAWHTCEKKHCRGGWVTTLAGAEGKKLEAFHGTFLSAMLIYDASDPDYRINPSRFFDSDEAALADMKRLAEKESA